MSRHNDKTHYPITYATADGRYAFKTTMPRGLMAPPDITLHQPLVGPVVFYYADCYPSITVAPDALTKPWPS